MSTTFLKRQKEMKRQEKQREKAERRKQKKLAKLNGDTTTDSLEVLDGPETDPSLSDLPNPSESDPL
jgi:uncharacterized Fe-S cluster-containing protein